MNAIDKEILRLAVPSIIANVTVPLLGLVDLSLSGHLESAVYIGAIAVASMMFNLIYWNFTFLRMGTTGMTAQYYGSGDRYMQSLTLYRSVGISLAIGVVLLALQDVLCSIALAVLKPGEEVAAAAVSYYRICIYGAPAVMVGMSLKGWFLGMQNSRYPMAVSIIENLLNVCANVIAVYVLGIGFKGIAVGTVVAVYTSCGLSAVLLVRRYGRELMPMSIAKILRSGGISRFFQVNADIFMRSVFLLVVTLAFTSIGARAGNEVLAVNATLMQLFLFYSYFTDGFAFAGEAVSGKYAGRGDASMFGRSTRRLMLWGTGVAVVFTVVYGLGIEPIAWLLSDYGHIRQGVVDNRLWCMVFPLAGVVAFMFDGIYVGLTASRQMLLSTLAGALTFFGVYYIGGDGFSNTRLWIAFNAYLLMRGGVLAVLFPKQIKRLNDITTTE